MAAINADLSKVPSDFIKKHFKEVNHVLKKHKNRNPAVGSYWESDIISHGLMAVAEAWTTWKGDRADEAGLLKHVRITINRRVIDMLRTMRNLRRGPNRLKGVKTTSNPLDCAESIFKEHSSNRIFDKNDGIGNSGRDRGLLSTTIASGLVCRISKVDCESESTLFENLVKGYDDYVFITILASIVTEGFTLLEAAEPYGYNQSAISIKFLRFCEWLKSMHNLEQDAKTIRDNVMAVIREIRHDKEIQDQIRRDRYV